MSANLLGLPRELRDQIYAYVLVNQNYTHLRTLKAGFNPRPLSPPLLRTNKTIYREATSLLYAHNRFNFAKCDPELIPLFFDRIGRDNAKHIWHIRIDFPEFLCLEPDNITLNDKSVRILNQIQSCCANLSTLTTSRSSTGAMEFRLHELDCPKIATDALKLVDTRFKAISTLQEIIVEVYYGRGVGPDIRRKMESHGWTLSTTEHVEGEDRFDREISGFGYYRPLSYDSDEDPKDEDYDYPAYREGRGAGCSLT